MEVLPIISFCYGESVLLALRNAHPVRDVGVALGWYTMFLVVGRDIRSVLDLVYCATPFPDSHVQRTRTLLVLIELAVVTVLCLRVSRD